MSRGISIKEGREDPMMLSLMLAFGLAAKAGDPPVQVWLNHNDYARGDRAKVYARTQQDGYLVVLRADADGRVRCCSRSTPATTTSCVATTSWRSAVAATARRFRWTRTPG